MKNHDLGGSWGLLGGFWGPSGPQGTEKIKNGGSWAHFGLPFGTTFGHLFGTFLFFSLLDTKKGGVRERLQNQTIFFVEKGSARRVEMELSLTRELNFHF